MVLHRLHGVVQLIWRAGELPRSASSHFKVFWAWWRRQTNKQPGEPRASLLVEHWAKQTFATTKKIHPVKRQIFNDAPGRTFYMTWDCVIHAGALVWPCHCWLPGQLVCMQRMNPLILRVSGKDSPHELWYPHLCTSLLATLCVRKDGILRNWDSSFDSQGLEEGFWTVAIMQKKARGQLPTRRYRSQRCS